MLASHLTYILFLFALGACIGSFLNVVVWRLPRGESLSSPPSHCPNCNKPLPWYDNIPIFGWIKLAGKCRFCREPISMRYPIVELTTALLFVFYYVMYYMADTGPCAPVPTLFFGTEGSPEYHAPEAPIFLLHLFMIACLLAASLIDLDKWLIPQSITYLMAAVAVLTHAIFDDPTAAGALNLVRHDGTPSPSAALAAGGAVGLGISVLLWYFGILKQSFPEGEPLLDYEREELEEENEKLKREGKELKPIPPPYGFRQLAAEMRKEMAFLLPPMMLAVGWWYLTAKLPAVGSWWNGVVGHHWVSGLLGSLLGAMVGAGIIWVTRILGTLGFRRVAMGLGDVDLMFGIGAVVGAGAAAVTFFIAPFFGLVLALYMLLFGKRRELPYGPYLGLAAAAVLLCYCPIEQWLEPGFRGLGLFVRGIGGGTGE